MSIVESDKEFQIGDVVTLDRYNHIDDVNVVKVVGYNTMPISGTLLYKMDVNGIIIESTGGSIVESKLYKPVAPEDRHHRLNAGAKEIDDYWNKKIGR